MRRASSLAGKGRELFPSDATPYLPPPPGRADVELTTLGKNEAAQGATAMWNEGLSVDVAFTSLLKRSQQTLDIVGLALHAGLHST